MDAVHYTAMTLNWAFTQLGTTAQILLNFHHSCFSVIVKVLHYIYSCICTTIQGTTSVLQCYMLDFIGFLEEVGSVIIIIAQLFSNVGFHIASSVYDMCGLVLNLFHSIYFHFATAVFTIANMFKMLIGACHAFIELIYSAILLLLLSIPNSFIMTFEVICYLVQNVLLLIKYSLFSLANSVYYVKMSCYHVILNMPLKAYIGLFLLVMFYYLHRRIIQSIKSFLCACAVISILAYIKTIDGLNYILVQIPRSVLLLWQRYRERFFFTSVLRERAYARNPELEATSSNSIYRLLRRARATKLRWANVSEDNTDEATNVVLQTLRRKLLEEEGKHLCVVCKDHERNVMLLPCRHFCLCEYCCTSLQRSFSGCPVCRREIVSSINVYV